MLVFFLFLQCYVNETSVTTGTPAAEENVLGDDENNQSWLKLFYF